jgi:hypothetical protein
MEYKLVADGIEYDLDNKKIKIPQEYTLVDAYRLAKIHWTKIGFLMQFEWPFSTTDTTVGIEDNTVLIRRSFEINPNWTLIKE